RLARERLVMKYLPELEQRNAARPCFFVVGPALSPNPILPRREGANASCIMPSVRRQRIISFNVVTMVSETEYHERLITPQPRDVPSPAMCADPIARFAVAKAHVGFACLIPVDRAYGKSAARTKAPIEAEQRGHLA